MSGGFRVCSRRGKDSMSEKRTVIFGVTVDYQLRYHDGLYQRLAAQGWCVHLVSTPGNIGRDATETRSITAHSVPMRRDPSPFSDVVSLYRWIRLLQRLKPDVIVAGTPKAGLLGAVAGWLTRVPVRIYELHGLRLETTSGALRRLLSIIERCTCAASTTVIAVSHSLRQRVISEGIAPSDKVDVLGAGSPNGVDVQHFVNAASDPTARALLREQLGITENEVVVIFVGRIAADKGIDALASALGQVQRTVPVVALLVGGVDDESVHQNIDQLRALVSRVRMVGDVDDVAPYLAASDVFCLPSRREGLPTVVLEALATGIPVVATTATGIVDLITNESTGLLVPVDDSDALAVALLRAIEDRELAQRLVAEGKKRVAASFSQGAVQDRWMEMLSSPTDTKTFRGP